jgi:geranylgeranyl diphosphate synthase, type II
MAVTVPDLAAHVENELTEIFAAHEALGPPPLLSAALRHAVFPGGARVRPRLCAAVALACGAKDLGSALSAAAAIELIHCASLVHDDLPCFDDADLRRGRPSVHTAYGEALAVLAGDGLIVLAFQALARSQDLSATRLAALLTIIGGAVSQVVAGQAWECEPAVPLATYHRAKTGSLFAAATMAGAVAAGCEAVAWRAPGELLGQAYQVADDIRDVIASTRELGKPVGVDAQHCRPSAVSEYGMVGAVQHLKSLVAAAATAIPASPGSGMLRTLIAAEVSRLLPEEPALRAA